MKAIVCEEPGRLVLVERPEPVASEGEVLVRIGVPASAARIFTFFGASSRSSTYPRVIGHELAGEVVRGACGQ